MTRPIIVLFSEAPSSSISKNQKTSFKPGHFYAKLYIKIDAQKCLKICNRSHVNLELILKYWGRQLRHQNRCC
jgi:hypothetical protein